MYPVRLTKRKTARAQALRELAAKRQSHWLSMAFAWAGFLAGCLSIFVLVAGLKEATHLPQVPRPHIGPGLSEATTASIGAMLFCGGFAFLAFLLVGLALIHSRNHRRTLAFLIPAITALGLLFSAKFWAWS